MSDVFDPKYMDLTVEPTYAWWAWNILLPYEMDQEPF